jgi:hypothetical protein
LSNKNKKTKKNFFSSPPRSKCLFKCLNISYDFIWSFKCLISVQRIETKRLIPLFLVYQIKMCIKTMWQYYMFILHALSLSLLPSPPPCFPLFCVWLFTVSVVSFFFLFCLAQLCCSFFISESCSYSCCQNGIL